MSNVSPLATWFGRATQGSGIDGAVSRGLASMASDTPVKVIAVHGGGTGAPPTVDVQPLVHMQDGQGKTTEHGTIYGLQCLRIQGGTNAIICDPKAGDLGFIVISGRDISNAVANKAPAAPGSFRMHDYADAVYVANMLCVSPTQYLLFTDEGARLVVTGKLTIEATEVDINCPVNVSGDVTANGISLTKHIHPGVQSGSSTTGAPE